MNLSTAAAAVWASIARTLVPAIVGQLLGLWAATGLPVDGQLEPALTVLLGLLLTGVYYAGVRVLETYVAPRFGWLLGLARTPVLYTAQSPVNVPDPLAALSADLAARGAVIVPAPGSGVTVTYGEDGIPTVHNSETSAD